MNSWGREMRFTDQPPSYAHLRAVQAERGGDGTLHEGAAVRCGWGRVIMGHTFSRPEDIARQLLSERPGKRDIAMYVADPHIVLATAPKT